MKSTAHSSNISVASFNLKLPSSVLIKLAFLGFLTEIHELYVDHSKNKAEFSEGASKCLFISKARAENLATSRN